MTPQSGLPALERVDDTAIVPLDITGFEALTPSQRIAVYHFAQAAKAGDRIMFDQGNRFHLELVAMLEGIAAARPTLPGDLLERLVRYLKLLWIHRGNHHNESTAKFLPGFTPDELSRAARAAASLGAGLGVPGGQSLEAHLKHLEPAFFDGGFHAQLTCKSPPAGFDVVTASAINYYEGVTADEVSAFKGRYALNSRLVRRGDALIEEVWRAGGEGSAPGLYARPLAEIVRCLEAALPWLDAESARCILPLTRYFRTGELEDYRAYNQAWVHSEVPVDVIIGFIEQYHDPLGRRGEFEGTVHIEDAQRAGLMRTLARESAWFEARMPWDPQYSRTQVEVPRAGVCRIVTLSGSTAPFGYSGVNLPSETEVREAVGTKSLLVGNLMRQRREISGDVWMREFCSSAEQLEAARKYSAQVFELFVGLHEVIGHGSGALSPDLQGTPEEHLKEYFNTLEEARADLVALWFMLEPRLVELGLLDSPQAAEEGYREMLRMTLSTISFLEEPHAEEDHDRAEMLIGNYLIERRAGVELIRRNGKTYLELTDATAMRRCVGELLSELMRIKAHGDYPAIRELVERYGVSVDPELHREIRARVAGLGVPARVAFINPRFEPILDGQGRMVDIQAGYPTDFYAEQMEISRTWRALHV